MGSAVKRPGALVLLVGLLLLAGCARSDASGRSGGDTPVVVVTRTVMVTVEPAATPVSTPSSLASPASEKGEWVAVAAGAYTTLALKRDGTLWAWGLNDYGQLGQGSCDIDAHPTPLQVGRRRAWAAASAGYGDNFALRADGTLWAWGNNSDFGGNLGIGMGGKVTWAGITIPRDRWSPTRVGHTADWVGVFAGFQHAVATKKDGSLWGWGSNYYGALGPQGSTSLDAVPTSVGSGKGWVTAAGGGDFSLAVKEDGSLWATGINMYGNLGLGDTADRHQLTQVGSTRDWAAVSAGLGYALALKKDGSLWAWGGNNFGQLGIGDTAPRRSPTQVGSETDWAQVSCLGHHSLALKRDGTLWAWGENSFGQLGVGDTADRHSPTQVGSSRDWAAIAAGGAASYHSLALKQDGTLWAWGLNKFGQLGLGDTSDQHTPAQVRAR
jgi:alpha-tubulin suppressor-like RCC1 family protein